jgi:hypothetical protein
MASAALSSVLEYIRRTAVAGSLGDLTRCVRADIDIHPVVMLPESPHLNAVQGVHSSAQPSS